jgi:hypothetical protein
VAAWQQRQFVPCEFFCRPIFLPEKRTLSSYALANAVTAQVQPLAEK